jgi:pimeloyl-ACP methyl ester carboxylesterase
MTLNQTIFPPLDLPTVSVDFTTLVLGPDGVTPDLRSRRIGVYVDLLDQRLASQSEWQSERRIVVAHSFGGMLALAWWLAHRGEGPARVDGMVLTSTVAGPLFDAVQVRLFRLGSFEMRVGLRRLIRTWNRPGMTRAIKRRLTHGSLEAQRVDFQKLPQKSDWALDFAGWRNTDWRAMRSYRQALEGFDVRDRLAEINVPVIVLQGEADTLFRPGTLRELAEKLPRAELRMVPGAGHGLPLTHGEAVRTAVGDLIRRVGREQ